MLTPTTSPRPTHTPSRGRSGPRPKKYLQPGEDRRLIARIRAAQAFHPDRVGLPGRPVDVSAHIEAGLALDDAERARRRLFEAVHQYVVSVAENYQGRGLDLDDLIQEGNSGILRAIDGFDPQKGFGFLTYADDWIRQRIRKACAEQGSIERYAMRIPGHQYGANGRVQRERPLLAEKLGREPTVEELAQTTDLKASAVQRALMTLDRSTVSLDAHWRSDDSDASLSEIIPDTTQKGTDALAIEGESRRALLSVFARLEPLEQDVLRLRYGLFSGKAKNQNETCAALGITKSQLVSAQNRALKKLRVAPEMADI